MTRFTLLKTFFIVANLACTVPCHAQMKLSNRQLSFGLTVPNTLFIQEQDNDTFAIYQDTTAAIVLIISAQASMFNGVNNYLDCTRQDLEKQLRKFQDDTTLKLVDCRRSAYYPEKAVVLHIETAAYLPHFDRCLIYFVHHNKKELQFFFLYKKQELSKSKVYIDAIMKSLTLTVPDSPGASK